MLLRLIFRNGALDRYRVDGLRVGTLRCLMPQFSGKEDVNKSQATRRIKCTLIASEDAPEEAADNESNVSSEPESGGNDDENNVEPTESSSEED